MSQSNRPQRLRANATQACTNCQRRHQRCERLSERVDCTFCRNYGLLCINILGRRRGRRPRSLIPSSGTIEAFYFSETIEAFIGQGQMSDDQNAASVNSYDPSFRTTEVFINQEPPPITTSINPYETTIKEFQSLYLNFLETAEAFIGQVPTPNHQNTTQINTYEPTTEEFQPPYSFETIQSFIGQGQTPDDQNTVSINSYEPSFRTTEAFINQESIPITTSINPYETSSVQIPLNINPYEAAETSQNTFPFIHEGPAQNNGPLIINQYQNITPFFISYSNDPSSLETSDPYNNIITSPNIYTYGTNEQSFLLPSSPFVREGSMQNNHLTINLSQNTNYSNDNDYYYSS